MHISQLIRSSKLKQNYLGDGVQVCKLPELEVNNPEILKFIHDVPPLQCPHEDWVVVQGAKFIIQDKAKQRYGSITCAFRGKIYDSFK